MFSTGVVFSTGILMNFAGGGVYTYFKYVDSQQQNGPAKDHTSTNQPSRYNISTANGHCIQAVDNPAGTVNVV